MTEYLPLMTEYLPLMTEHHLCLTELFQCMTEYLVCLTEPPKNVKNKIFYPKHLVLIGILKNPRDKIREFIFKKLCQEDFAMGPLFKVDFGKFFF